VVLPTPPPPSTAATSAPAASTPPSTATADLGWYLQWYGADYVAVATVGGLYFTGVHKQITPAPALIGPQFDLEKPDLAALNDPRLDDVIGQTYLSEKIPDSTLTLGLVGALIVGAGVETVAHGDLHRTHNFLLGGTEALLGTVLVTEALKLSFGRLRPDFRERWLRAACGGTTAAPDGLDCSAVDDGFVISEEDLKDGMKSFVSGHSSSSFAVATYLSLWAGSQLVWGDDVPDWGPAVGALAIGGLTSTAAAVAATRVADHRHHVEDVVAGAGLGATLGAVAYFVHFDVDGRARRRGLTVVPLAGMGATQTGQGLALAGSF
jgi:membrane-associated phospholipid phosphatase